MQQDFCTAPYINYVYNLRFKLYSCSLFLEEGSYGSGACIIIIILLMYVALEKSENASY